MTNLFNTSYKNSCDTKSYPQTGGQGVDKPIVVQGELKVSGISCGLRVEPTNPYKARSINIHVFPDLKNLGEM